MADETKNPYSRPENSSDAERSPTVAYCQECGLPLTAGKVHRTANGIFCSPCALQRQTNEGWKPVDRPGTAASPSSMAGSGGSPSPAIAGLLGFIPGVGAMYNGQYAKGALHLIVFVVLVSVADNLNGVFYWLVWGWVFYQAFDAYHTAVARRDGAPLPNPFGWNDIGDRFGFHRVTPSNSVRETVSTQTKVQEPRREYAVPERPAEARPWPPYAESERSRSDNPYAEPFQASVEVPKTPPPGYMSGVPYSPTYTGYPSAPENPVKSSTNQRRFPAGAFWLIGLGVVFLSGNLLPALRLSGRWLVPLVLAAVALWTAARRWEQFRLASELSQTPVSLSATLSGPMLLFMVSFLLCLDTGGVLSMRRSWPLLLVVWGVMLLARRSPVPPAGKLMYDSYQPDEAGVFPPSTHPHPPHMRSAEL